MGSTRRTLLAAGAAAAATAAVPRVFAQQADKAGVGKFYEKGSVRIYYEEAGSGFPLMLLCNPSRPRAFSRGAGGIRSACLHL
jgi:hypothetical protein